MHYDSRTHGSLTLWIFLLFGSMFKFVRRIFFWGSLALIGTSMYLQDKYMYMWHQPWSPTSHFFQNTPTYEVVGDILLLGIFMFVMWFVMAVFALIGRQAKRLLQED